MGSVTYLHLCEMGRQAKTRRREYEEFLANVKRDEHGDLSTEDFVERERLWDHCYTAERNYREAARQFRGEAA